MTPQTPERPPETFFESIASAPKRLVNYLWQHPLQSTLNFLFITAGLAGLRHLGLFSNIPLTGGWQYLRGIVDTPARWSQMLYSHSLGRIGTNIGGYSPWVSEPARIFSAASRSILDFSTPLGR